MSLPHFPYDIGSGPVQTPDELETPILKGNCRLAVQWYLYKRHGLWLEPEQVLCPALYRSTGRFVGSALADGREGDVILGERIRNSRGEHIDRSRSYYASEDEWIVYLHSAIVIDPKSEAREGDIWHATHIAKGTCVWEKTEFERYYRVVAIKRIVENGVLVT